MSYERESYMRAQDAHHDMIAMRQPIAQPIHTPAMRENAIQTIAVVRDIIRQNETHLARINRGELADVGGYQGAGCEKAIGQARAIFDAQLQIVTGLSAAQIAESMGGVA